MNQIINQTIFVAAFKTFIQAFVASWLIFDAPFTQDALAAAAAAAISATANYLITRTGEE